MLELKSIQYFVIPLLLVAPVDSYASAELVGETAHVGLPACIPGNHANEVCTFDDGEVEGYYNYEVIFVPSNVTVTAIGRLSLFARGTVSIDGAIVGETPKTNYARAPDIFIGGGSAVIRGVVRAASGASGAPILESGKEVIGGDGGKGGDLIVGAIELILGPNAVLAAGDGGPGKDVDFRNPDANETQLRAFAGDGGGGGALLLLATTQGLAGKLRAATGGRGGDAFAAIDPSHKATMKDGNVTVTGGRGGASGILTILPQVDPIALYLSGALSGGHGGRGGDATAITTNWSGDKNDPAPDRRAHHCRGADAKTLGKNGNHGCSGGNVRVEGGAGAAGLLFGGPGGNASGFGASGGQGGRGGASLVDATTHISPGIGGHGGDAASIETVAGYGGPGGYLGGTGGMATTVTGFGGDGGQGGDGSGFLSADEDPVATCILPARGGHGGTPLDSSATSGGGGAGVFGGNAGPATIDFGYYGRDGLGGGLGMDPAFWWKYCANR